LLARLAWLGREEPTLLERIARWHALQLMTACLQFPASEFFDTVAELIPLPTDDGDITLREYAHSAERLDDGRRAVYYVAHAESAAQFALLARARRRRVIHGGRAIIEPFLACVAARWPERFALMRLDGAASDLFTDAPPDVAARFDPLLRCVRALTDAEVRLSVFEPAEVPMVLTEPTGAADADLLRDIGNDPVTPDFVRAAVTSVAARSAQQIVVHVNANNETMQRLGDRAADAVTAQAVRMLHASAVVAHARESRATQLNAAWREQQRLIAMILQPRP